MSAFQQACPGRGLCTERVLNGLPSFLSCLCNNSTEPWDNDFGRDLWKEIWMGCLSYWKLLVETSSS